MIEIVDFYIVFLRLCIGSSISSEIIFYWRDDEIFLRVWYEWNWHCVYFFIKWDLVVYYICKVNYKKNKQNDIEHKMKTEE